MNAICYHKGCKILRKREFNIPIAEEMGVEHAGCYHKIPHMHDEFCDIGCPFNDDATCGVYSEAWKGDSLYIFNAKNELEMRRMERFLGMTLADMHRNPEQELPMNSEFVSKHLGKKSVQNWMNHYLTNPTEIDYVAFPYELMYYREADVPSEDILEEVVQESAAKHAVVDEDDFDFDGEF